MLPELRRLQHVINAANMGQHLRVAYVNCSDQVHALHHAALSKGSALSANMLKGKDLHLKHRALQDKFVHKGSLCEAHNVISYPTARFYREHTRSAAFNYVGAPQSGYMLGASLRVMGAKFSHANKGDEQTQIEKKVVALHSRAAPMLDVMAN